MEETIATITKEDSTQMIPSLSNNPQSLLILESPPDILSLHDSTDSPLSSPEKETEAFSNDIHTPKKITPLGTPKQPRSGSERDSITDRCATNELVFTNIGKSKRLRTIPKSDSVTDGCAAGGVDNWQLINTHTNYNEKQKEKDNKIENTEMQTNNDSKNIENDKIDMMSIATVESLDFESSDDESINIDNAQDPPHANSDMARPFDMDLLQHSIRVGSQALDQVQGRDVVLIIGKTGTGKSTLIQGLAGKKIKLAVHNTDYNGQRVQKKVFEVEDPLCDFDIGHDKASKTKAIRSYEHHLTSTITTAANNLDDKVLTPPRKILYVDSPGFEDTDGHEMDIATSVMLSQVAKKCNSLRFCVLIHYASLLEDRGDAIRAILKFTRKFVKDFNDDKQSFVFLFTHVNEMYIMDGINPSSMDQCRTYLLEEIIRILKETKDDDVKTVLEFMRKCLKRNFPLVDVLHPLKSDFEGLRNTLETKLKAVKNPILAWNCGLTMASKSKLNGEVLSLNLRLRHLLNHPPVDACEINKIRDIFHYLGKHMEMPDMQEAVSACDKLVDNYCLSQKRLIDQEIENGKDSSYNFSYQNAQSLNTAKQQLLDLDHSFRKKNFHERLNREIGNHYNNLLEQPCGEFRIAILQLDKLHAWKEVFHTNFSSLYQSFCTRLKAVIKSHYDVISDIKTSELENESNDNIILLVRSLAALDSLAAYEQHKSHHGISIVKALDASRLAKESITSVVLSWTDAESTIMNVEKMDDEILQSVAFRAKCLSVFSTQLEKLSVCQFLIKPMRAALRDFEERLVGHFDDFSRKIIEIDPPLNANAIQNLKILKQASSHLAKIKGERWREIQFYYTNAVSCIKSKLSVKSKEIDDSTEVANFNLFIDGKNHGMSLFSFDSCISLDDFFDPEDRFIKNCSIKYHHVYNERIKLVITNTKKLFDSLYKPSTNSVQVLIALKAPLQEIDQISKFIAAVGGDQWSTMVSGIKKKMMLYIKKVTKKKDDAILQWTTAVDKREDPKKIKIFTEDLSQLLCELNILLSLVKSGKVADIISEITNALKTCNKSMMDEVSNTNDYSTLFKLLSCANAFGNFHESTEHLPKFTMMKDIVLSTVSKNAQKIEDMVSRTSKWDMIDIELENFKKAANLDLFIGGQVASRLGPLLKLRAQKEDAVDKVIEALITQEDFKGIGEFLAPLATSTCQMNRQKFTKYLKQIISSLYSRIEESERILNSTMSTDGAKTVANGIEKLKDANSEIGYYLRTHSPLRLDQQIKTLIHTVNSKFMDILNSSQIASDREDFFNVATFQNRAENVWHNLKLFLYVNSKKKRKQVQVSFSKKIHSVSSIVDKFVNSNFVDAAQLLGVLSSLHKCSESEDTVMLKIAAFYGTTLVDLLDKTNEKLRRLDSWTCETKCYDDGITILGSLVRQLQGGLHSHVKETNLEFNCQQKLESWKAGKKTNDKEMDFRGQDAEQKLQSWSSKLDKLLSPSIITIAAHFFFASSTYENECNKLHAKITDMLALANEALQTRDFKVLQECIDLLILVTKNMFKHVKKVSVDVTHLKELTTNEFISLTKKIEHTLEEEMFSQFEGQFIDFKGFLLHVPHLLVNEKSKKAFALINQLVFEVLYKKIERITSLASMEGSFDFLALKSEIEGARFFGDFVADNFTLLHEKLKNTHNGYEEEWLVKISQVSHKHFYNGREFSLLRYFAVLDIIPSSSAREIKVAYRSKAKETHPDKQKSGSMETANYDFQKVNEAQEILLEAAKARKRCHSRPFDLLINNLGKSLREKVSEYLNEQGYARSCRNERHCYPTIRFKKN